jgi:hypothetical protein
MRQKGSITVGRGKAGGAVTRAETGNNQPAKGETTIAKGTLLGINVIYEDLRSKSERRKTSQTREAKSALPNWGRNPKNLIGYRQPD